MNAAAPNARVLREIAWPEAGENSDLTQALCAGFDHVRQGLYVFVFANPGTDVFDNPKKAERRKIVVHGRGVSIKPGKFEKGLAERLASYTEHLHRRTDRGEAELVLAECFRHAYLLDLTDAISAVGNPAPIFERYWVEAVERYLDASGLLSRSARQKKRSEWRYVQTDRWTPTQQAAFREHLDGVARSIFEMARVGAFPSAGTNPSGVKVV
jgi:hypothetical protein